MYIVATGAQKELEVKSRLDEWRSTIEKTKDYSRNETMTFVYDFRGNHQLIKTVV